MTLRILLTLMIIIASPFMLLVGLICMQLQRFWLHLAVPDLRLRMTRLREAVAEVVAHDLSTRDAHDDTLANRAFWPLVMRVRNTTNFNLRHTDTRARVRLSPNARATIINLLTKAGDDLPPNLAQHLHSHLREAVWTLPPARP